MRIHQVNLGNPEKNKGTIRSNMEYKIAFGTSRIELEMMVKEMIEDGFIPQGGLTIAYSTFREYCQAMVKRKG